MANKRPLYYGDYLQLDKLLSCQDRESLKHSRPAHDEMLFIIIHQAYELWFKQIIFEMNAVMDVFAHDHVDERDMGRIVHSLRRIVEIQKVLVAQIDILETMTPLDFLDFRDLLVPASGFQSIQFRTVEGMMGLKGRTNFGDRTMEEHLSEADLTKFRQIENAPCLFDRMDAWLSRTPFLDMDGFNFWDHYRQAVDDMLASDTALVEANPILSDSEREHEITQLQSVRKTFDVIFDEPRHDELVAQGEWRLSYKALQGALMINLYRDEPIFLVPHRILGLLMDIDENFTTWRYRHALMVRRMIGRKIGTGGSSGHDYLLKSAQEHKVFRDLFAMSTFFVPRSKLPELPEEVKQAMSFCYTRAA